MRGDTEFGIIGAAVRSRAGLAGWTDAGMILDGFTWCGDAKTEDDYNFLFRKGTC